jgi:hypothetical protein
LRFLHHECVFGGAGREYVVEKATADTLSSKVVGGAIGVHSEWFAEHLTFSEVLKHPCTAGESLHDLSEIGNAVAFRKLGSFLGLTDVLAIAAIVH